VQDLERRADGASGRTAGGVANQLAPGHRTLVEDLDSTPVTAPDGAVDAGAAAAQPDRQSGFAPANGPGTAAPASASGPLGLAEVAGNEFDAYFLGDKVSDKLGLPRDEGLTLDEAIARVTGQ
jgi:hypothetical protein